ncbi:heterodisulfide reductase-related iron-sulfur binding cluster [Pseudogemmatithrix spongiicola]|uniref:Glycolate oxidase iron-sulfur subunit n=1 Tax=Pseudogemmatithrix spongiicola TaxID=3062599 RepID=A0AA49Q6V4_9BACT|nr:heterodisulfide reductase-related iron-sulfur binding cluster [Gemmatimonadaceae bacterium 'strain 138']WKW14069.1 heterodisulfide reductase-related iron-sulfur binding cluster [Gemmatimonadaceae bacterium 'strain 318']
MRETNSHRHTVADDAMRHGLDACVHCGFCLPACPTYLALDDENDSPRGRLVLMRALLDGRIAGDDPDVARHLDQCLGCRGCETACPSGVPYGRILEGTRERQRVTTPLPLLARVVLAVFARDRLLRIGLWTARVVRALGVTHVAARLAPRALRMPAAMLATTARDPVPTYEPRGTGSRGRTALLTGCVMEGLLPSLNRATERVLVENDFALVRASGQVCCGALHAHAGDTATARDLARRNIAAFEASGAEFIAMNSAGCGAMCREYGELLADDSTWAARASAFSAKVRDVSELLVQAGPKPTAPTASQTPVAWDAPCHLQHAQRIVEPPLQVLHAVGDVRLVPLQDSAQCCGSAGIYGIVQPDVAQQVLKPKLARIHESGARIVATANPGCLMQIGAGLLVEGSAVLARHPVELLDAAYARSRTD